MNDHDKDTVVARALATMRVPDHRPDFWDRLDDAIAAKAPASAAPSPSPIARPAPPARLAAERGEPNIVIDLSAASVRTRRRRGLRHAVPVALATAMALVLAIVSITMASDDRGLDLSSQPTTAPTSGSDPNQTPGTEARSTTLPIALPADPRALEAVTTFVDALGRGDLRAAAGLLGPRSEQYATETAGSVDAMLRTATEGYGSWVSSTDRETIGMTIEDGVVVVILRGTRLAEGMAEQRVDAIPARHAESADAWFVEPWAFDPSSDSRIELVDPEPLPDGVPHVAAGGAITVAAPEGATVRFAVLGRGFDPPVTAIRADGVSAARWQPSALLPTGPQTVVVAAELDGVLTASTMPVIVG